MLFETLLIPVWKTRDYSFEIAKLQGTYQIYLKRLGKFYMKNEQGVKVKFSARDAKEEEFYTKVYKEKKSIAAGMISVVPDMG